jgi:predicted DNA-binding protein (MmcQ/YjbR family)
MHLDALRTYCLGKPAATEDQPFGPGTLVFKVGGRMFALASLDKVPAHVALKCDPECAVELRERYAGVTTAPYMDKRLWNSVALDGEVPAGEIREMVDESYRLVVAKLPRARRRELGIETG